MLIDSHCHLVEKLYKKPPEELISDAKKAQVETLITVGNNLKDSAQNIELAEKHENVYATVGIYPHEDQDKTLEELRAGLENLISSEKVVAIGECGIDIQGHPNERPIQKQLELLEMQIELAVKHSLPIVIHNRNGDEHIIKLLEKYTEEGLTGVFHCFTSDWEMAQKALAIGFYLSFTAIITYPSGKDLLEVAKQVPNDKILIETDAPFLPPQGHRGEINEPKYVRITAKTLADT